MNNHIEDHPMFRLLPIPSGTSQSKHVKLGNLSKSYFPIQRLSSTRGLSLFPTQIAREDGGVVSAKGKGAVDDRILRSVELLHVCRFVVFWKLGFGWSQSWHRSGSRTICWLKAFKTSEFKYVINYSGIGSRAENPFY